MAGSALPPLVVMGVSGCGKSTVGALLATRLRTRFIDGDDLHPRSNKEKMGAGIPLEDADRLPWLERIGVALKEGREAGSSPVVACSALKRSYRDVLRSHVPDVAFVHLAGDPRLLHARLASRQHEFMPMALLDSQLATLEPLGHDERHLMADIVLHPELLVEDIEGRLLAAHRADA